MIDEQSENQMEQQLQMSYDDELREPRRIYQSMFGKVFSTISNWLGPDSTFGQKLKHMADEYEDIHTSNHMEFEQESLNKSVMNQEQDAYLENKTKMSEEQMLRERDVTGFQEKSMSELVRMNPDQIKEYEKDKNAYEFQKNERKQNELLEQKYQENLPKQDITNQKMVIFGKQDVEYDVFFEADKHPKKVEKDIRKSMNDLETKLLNEHTGPLSAIGDRPNAKQNAAHSYLSMMHGIESYDKAAQDAIRNKYQNDPKKLESAQRGLDTVVSSMTARGFDMISTMDNSYHFLSEMDKEELNNMSFSGVGMSYDNYVNIRYPNDKSLSKEDAMFASAGLDDYGHVTVIENNETPDWMRVYESKQQVANKNKQSSNRNREILKRELESMRENNDMFDASYEFE